MLAHFLILINSRCTLLRCRRLSCSTLLLPLLLAHPYQSIALPLHEVTAEHQMLHISLPKASMSHQYRYYGLWFNSLKAAFRRLGGSRRHRPPPILCSRYYLKNTCLKFFKSLEDSSTVFTKMEWAPALQFSQACAYSFASEHLMTENQNHPLL